MNWSIDSKHNLMWGGAPYIPVGMEIGASPEAVAGAKKSGFGDVIVDLPPDGADWKSTISSLESSGMRYILSIDGLFPSAKGFAIEPEAYRIDHITGDQHVEFPLPGATSALVVLVTQRDSAVETSERVPITNDKFSYNVKTNTDLDEVLLVYPEQSDAGHPDYWDQFDGRRDAILSELNNCAPGPGLRAVLNPLGRMFSSSVGTGLFLPESPYFRSELIAYLRGKYRSVDTAIRAWGIGTNDLESFDALATLAPLWSGSRGIAKMWDTSTNTLYDCDSKHSNFWIDVDTVVAAAAAKRFERLIFAIQSVTNVPVLQDWTGWAAPFEASTAVLSGIGFNVSGNTSEDIIEAAARPTSSVLRWKSQGWLVCTQLEIADSSEAASSFRDLMDQMESMGVRGWFLRDSGVGVISAAAADAARRGTDAVAASFAPDPLFFPENALNPAFPKRLPGGKWWLPAPLDGNRLDFGSGFLGYVTSDGAAFETVLWTNGPPKLTTLRAANAKSIAVTTIDGAPVQFKMEKNGVEVTIDQVPIVIRSAGEIPVPQESFDETANNYAQLVSLADSLHKEISEYTLFLRDIAGRYDKDPGGSLQDLRKKFWELNRICAPFVWLEAESSRDTNFSEIAGLSGCSNGSALVLHTPVTTDPKGFHAEYSAHSLSKVDQEVWIAGKIPKEMEKYVTVDVAGQRLGIEDGPVSKYSDGFGWYKLGTVKLTAQTSDVSLRVNSPQGAYLAIDLVLLYPGNFKPDGVTMPPAVSFVHAKPGKRKR